MPLNRRTYDAAFFVDVGTSASIVAGGKMLRTTTVQYANSGLGVFRTKNSLYIPSESCVRYHHAVERPYFVLS